MESLDHSERAKYNGCFGQPCNRKVSHCALPAFSGAGGSIFLRLLTHDGYANSTANEGVEDGTISKRPTHQLIKESNYLFTHSFIPAN
jgi:hypothetical protein